MGSSQYSRIQIKLTALVAACIIGLLLWQSFGEGVPSHHLLHRSDLPAISNWWGVVILPALAWFTSGIVYKRESESYPAAAKLGFFGSLIYGVVLSASFSNGMEQISSWMGPALLAIALFFPIYRAEYLLGFVLGMSYTFGAVLPTGFGLIICGLAFVIYKVIRPIPIYLYGKLVRSKRP